MPDLRIQRDVSGERSDGARGTDAYLRRHGLTVPGFCEAHGIKRHAFEKALNGKVARITVDFAFFMQNATGGEVAASMWLASTRRLDSGKRKSRAPRAKSARGGE